MRRRDGARHLRAQRARAAFVATRALAEAPEHAIPLLKSKIAAVVAPAGGELGAVRT